MTELNQNRQAPSVAVTMSDSFIEQARRPFDQANAKDLSLPLNRLSSQVKFKALRFNRIEISLLAFTLLTLIFMIAGLLYLQYNNSQLLEATQQYKINTAEIQKQSNHMTESITQQFNYDKIKETADQNQMSIDKSRIRTVHE